MIKSLIKKLTTTQQRVAMKKMRRHFLSHFKKSTKISIHEMRKLLVDDLGVERGNRIIVSSSFGNLNADFSPQQLIELLMDILGDEGVIMMPYYPPMNSTEWVKTNNVFDMRKTKSGMGILTNAFSKMPNVIMSCHPTKAVCVWGKRDVVEEIVKDHDISTTPYYWNSPYGRLLKMGSKSLCLGLKQIPMFHAIEDVVSSDYTQMYEQGKYKLEIIDLKGQRKIVETYVHDAKVLEQCMEAGDYVACLPLRSYKKINCGYKYCICVDNTEVLNVAQVEYAKGNTRYALGKG